MVDYLCLLGGATPGDTVRRMLRKLGTNALWASYSLKGRKGKKKFMDLKLYPVVVEACQRNHPKTLLKAIDACISDTLRYAPHRGTQVNEASGLGPDDDSHPAVSDRSPTEASDT